MSEPKICDVCAGTGRVEGKRCSACSASGIAGTTDWEGQEVSVDPGDLALLHGSGERYAVIGATGRYDEYHEWLFAIYDDRDTALDVRDRLNHRGGDVTYSVEAARVGHPDDAT